MEEVVVVDVVEEYLDPDNCWTDGIWMFLCCPLTDGHLLLYICYKAHF